MLFHRAAPLYLIEKWTNLELKRGRQTESGVLDDMSMFVYRLYCHIMAKADFPSEPCASVLLMQSYICSKVDARSLSLRPLYAGCLILN